MSGVRGIRRKRKYYKRSMFSFGYVFAPTGALQPAMGKFLRMKKNVTHALMKLSGVKI